METKNNPLLCNPDSGICEIPGSETLDLNKPNQYTQKKLKLIYFTDPICSSCWGIEPQLRKLKLEYGNQFEIEYHMGGLLPDWSYNSGGISKPSDVAHHWDEVAKYYQMPIDGDVWLIDPLASSYPPSIAFKAAQLQDEHKAVSYMRELREMVFLRKINIARQENLLEAALRVGLDTAQLSLDMEGKAKTLFEQDLGLARAMGVRGFPSIFVVNEAGQHLIYGSQAYDIYVNAMKNGNKELESVNYLKTPQFLFEMYPTMTTREFAELADIRFESAEKQLKALAEQGKIEQFETRNGSLWISK